VFILCVDEHGDKWINKAKGYKSDTSTSFHTMKFTALLAATIPVGLVSASPSESEYDIQGGLDAIREALAEQKAIRTNVNILRKKVNLQAKDFRHSFVKSVGELKAAIADDAAALAPIKGIKTSLESSLAAAIAEKNPTFSAMHLGRWVIQPESDIALCIRDKNTGGDKRYAFYNGGNSDMYKAGTGNEIVLSKASFPSRRWQIQEESGTYLVARDGATSATGKDSRYAFAASKYRDL
jgi:hypothetical protein